MKSSEGYFVKKHSLRQSIASARGKYSSLFTSGVLNKEDSSIKQNLEAGVKMEGYEVNIRKSVESRTDMHKPIAGTSDFWLG